MTTTCCACSRSPGFSTAASVTSVSGRGVGIDAVLARVRTLGGTLSLRTALGAGTTLTLRLPVTLAVTRALLACDAGGETLRAAADARARDGRSRGRRLPRRARRARGARPRRGRVPGAAPSAVASGWRGGDSDGRAGQAAALSACREAAIVEVGARRPRSRWPPSAASPKWSSSSCRCCAAHSGSSAGRRYSSRGPRPSSSTCPRSSTGSLHDHRTRRSPVAERTAARCPSRGREHRRRSRGHRAVADDGGTIMISVPTIKVTRLEDCRRSARTVGGAGRRRRSCTCSATSPAARCSSSRRRR